MCLKCSTSQAALRPQGREWNQSSATSSAPPPLFLPPCSILRYIAASLINHHSLHPSILLPLSREQKQTAVRVMNSKWIWRAEGPNNLLQRSAAAAAAAAHAHLGENKCANSIKQIWSAPWVPPVPSKPERSCCLNQYCSLSQPVPSRWLVFVCVCVCIMGARVSHATQ